MGGFEERPDLVVLCVAQTTRAAPERIDEEAVAPIGGDAPGAGVGLVEVALLLEHRHLVAHGGRRHVDPLVARHVVRAHRLGGFDVLLHDGPEDGRLAFIEHAGLSLLSGFSRALALEDTECQLQNEAQLPDRQSSRRRAAMNAS